MAHVTIPPGRLGAFIKASVGKNARAVQRGVRRGAMRGIAILTRKTPVDQGIMKNAWKYVEVGGSVGSPVIGRIENKAPHAGIIERGARPHMPPLEPILEWVKRHLRNFGMRAPTFRQPKFGPWRNAKAYVRHEKRLVAHAAAVADFEDDVLKLAEAIRWKIFKYGSQPHWIVKSSLEDLKALVNDEVNKAIARAIEGESDG